jgi:hypothetical protein
MYRVTYTRKRTDNQPIIDQLPESRLYSSVLHRFRSSQPGFVNFVHTVTDDQITLLGIADWETKEAHDACEEAILLNPDVLEARSLYQEFCQSNGIELSISYETV